MTILRVLCLICVVNAYALPDYASGLFEVHTRPFVIITDNDMYRKETGFLVDRQEGLIVCVSAPESRYALPFVGQLTLEGKNGDVLRGYCVQKAWGIALIQVVEQDRHLLKRCYEFRVADRVFLGQKVLYQPRFELPLWRHTHISDLRAFRHSARMARLRIPKSDELVPSGVPVLSEDRGEVLGVVTDVMGTSLVLLPGYILHFQLQHFKERRQLFGVHLGVILCLHPKGFLEILSGCVFNPPGYDISKTQDNTLVVVNCLYRVNGRALTTLKASDVILSINGHPIYMESDVWKALRAAHESGMRFVLVRVWRYGEVVVERAPLREFNTDPIKQIYCYGPLSLYQAASPLDKEHGGVMVNWDQANTTHPLCILERVNDHPVGGLEDAIAALSQYPRGGVFLHMSVEGPWRYRKNKFAPAYRVMHYIPQDQDPLRNIMYVADPIWREKN